MTDISQGAGPEIASPASVVEREDRTFAAVVYGLYFIGLGLGVTMLLGLVVAYAKRGAAGPRMRSHYVFQIRTVWIGLAWAMIGGLLMMIGIPLSILLIGIPIFQLGVAILSLIYVWLLARCVTGAIFLAQDAPYPRPRSWLI